MRRSSARAERRIHAAERSGRRNLSCAQPLPSQGKDAFHRVPDQMTDGFTKGKTQLGIYELEGDTFKACFSKPGTDRPADFTSKPGDGRTFSIWKRVKTAPPAPKQN
jgi:hypothetical protein